jgi:hypothetical protein
VEGNHESRRPRGRVAGERKGGGGSAHDRRIRRRDPRSVQASVLARAVEGGAFDDLLEAAPEPPRFGTPWAKTVLARAAELVGWPAGKIRLITMATTLESGPGFVRNGLTLRFTVDHHDGR